MVTLIMRTAANIRSAYWCTVTSSTNTWNANTATVAGYVAAPGANIANKVWKTGSDGTPAWRDDAAGTSGVTTINKRV